jgi:hypothetical protein
MSQFQQTGRRKDGSTAPLNSEFSSGFCAGYRQALNAMLRAAAAGVPPEAALTALEAHLVEQLLVWRNNAPEGTQPPKMTLWK